MDRSFKITPESILAQLRAHAEAFHSDPMIRKLHKQLLLSLTVASLLVQSPAFAADAEDAPYGIMQAYEREAIAKASQPIIVR